MDSVGKSVLHLEVEGGNGIQITSKTMFLYYIIYFDSADDRRLVVCFYSSVYFSFFLLQ